MKKAVMSNAGVSKCVVSVFLFCLFHLILISGSYASDSDTVAIADASDPNIEQQVKSPQGSENLTSKNPQNLSFVEGSSNLSSSRYLSKPAELTVLTACVAVGFVGAIIGGVKYSLSTLLPFHDFDWYEFSAACILGAATAIGILLFTAFGPAILTTVFGAVAADEVGFISLVQSWLAGFLRRAVSGITSAIVNFNTFMDAIDAFDAEFEDVMRDYVQALIDASSGQYQVPDFDSRWIDFSTATPELYGMAYSGIGAEFNTDYGTSWRLLNPDSSQITLNFDFANTPNDATLLLTHLSSASQSCPGGGYSPVDIYINGYLLEDNYDVAEQHCGSHGFKTDRWDISGHLSTQNTVVIELEDDPRACTHYWVQNITIFPGTPSEDDETTFFVSPFAGNNGSIEPNDPVWASECDDIVFTANPDNGYKVQYWYLGGLIYQEGGTVFEISDIQASHSVNVTFEPIEPASGITVLSPNGGEVYEIDGSMPIIWTSIGDIGNHVRIELWRNGAFERLIEESVYDDGSTSWGIPWDVPVTGCYKVRVFSVADLSIWDESDDCFAIVDTIDIPDTIKIYTVQDLQAIGSDGAHPSDTLYKLMKDINASGFTFQPIGTGGNYFTGVLDGQGYSIQYLEIKDEGAEYLGLFSIIDNGGVVKNLTLLDPEIRGDRSVGAFVGYNEGSIINCTVTATASGGGYIRGNSRIGGIAGENVGIISQCTVSDYSDSHEIYVRAEVEHVGGIAGVTGEGSGTDALVEYCFVDCEIWGKDDYNGGIAGGNYDLVIGCVYEGALYGSDWGNGGIVGWNHSGLIKSCYFGGSFERDGTFMGGIVGWFDGGTIEDCYAAGTMVYSPKGGLAGRCSGTIMNSFWDTQVTGCSEAYIDGGCNIICSYGLPTVEMMQETTYTTRLFLPVNCTADWDFDDVWVINENVSYPTLRGLGDSLSIPVNVIASSDLSDGVHVSWDPVSFDAGGGSYSAVYRVYRSDSPDANPPETEVSGWHEGNTLVDSTAIPTATYYYWVQAAAGMNGVRASDLGGPAQGQRTYPLADTPTGILATDSLPHSILIEWDKADIANFYHVYRSISADGSKTPLGSWQAGLSYIDIPPYPDTVYYYWVRGAMDDTGGYISEYGGPDSGYSVGFPVDVGEDDQQLLPQVFSVSQNYPNPFNPSTVIEFDLPRRSHVTLTVYNILGQEVSRLIDRQLSAGYHSISWEGKNTGGNSVATGVYLYRLVADDFIDTKRMILLK